MTGNWEIFMKKLIPITTEGDCARIHDALSQLLLRAKQDKNLDTRCGLGAVAIISALEKYYSEEWSVDQVCERINRF